MGSVAKVVGGVLVVVLLLGGIYALKKVSEDDKSKLPKAKVVVDEKSGIAWKMHGKPEVVESTSDLVLGTSKGTEVTVRTYTVDHGTWIERVKVFDVAPGEIDFTAAARTVFDAPEDAEFGDLAYVKVDGFDGAAGTMPGTMSKGGDDADTQVFATQMHSYMVTGGVAQRDGADTVDVSEQEERLRTTVDAA